MLKIRGLVFSILVLAAASFAFADTGVVYTCSIAGEGVGTVYLDSTETSGAVKWAGKTSADVPAKKGSFRVEMDDGVFTFVASSKGGYLNVKSQKVSHSGTCK